MKFIKEWETYIKEAFDLNIKKSEISKEKKSKIRFLK